MKLGAGKTAPPITSTIVALVALAAGLFIAAHHPLSPAFAMAGCVLALLICARFDHAWLLLLPALLPVVDLAPWTGWLTFEEFDILVLAAAAGAWLRHGWVPGASAPARPSAIMLILVAVYLAALAMAFTRGIVDAGGFDFGWFQSYDGAMNSLRLAKSFVLAALFAPLLGRASSRLETRGVPYLGWGMALGLGTVALAVIWERVAFPGLLNFSSDYRTTALFWEMHVGGAALDGFLVLTLPFAIMLLLRGRHIGQLAPAILLLGLGVYASLTTFSRGVYLAGAISLAMMAFMLVMRRGSRATTAKTSLRTLFIGLLATGATIGLSHLVFRDGGYRTLLAVLGCLAAVMATTPLARAAGTRGWLAALSLALPLTGATFAIAWLVDKGAYFAYAVVLALTIASGLFAQRTQSHTGRAFALAGSGFALPCAAALVALHWGSTAALVDASIALAVIILLAGWSVVARRPAWPTGLRQQGAILAGVLSLAGMVVVFGGGAYMGNRFATSERDFEGRLLHWRAGLNLLQTPADWLVGKGTGRFPANFFFGAPGNEFPGSYQLGREDDNAFLTISGPRYEAGYGEVLRIGQRVEPGPAGRHRLEFDLRTEGKAKLEFGICSKHLLYAEACGGREFVVPDTEGIWLHQTLEFNVPRLNRGTWFAPQLVSFSLAIETLGGRADLDNLRLVDAMARPMLANGDFSDEMARWFFTSDHHHMPWHMKNMFLHVLVEQGLLGLAAWLALVATALFRSLRGRRSHHPLAAPLAAAIVGFLVVGLFDSLLDVPRVAFLFFLVLLIAIQGRKAG